MHSAPLRMHLLGFPKKRQKSIPTRRLVHDLSFVRAYDLFSAEHVDGNFFHYVKIVKGAWRIDGEALGNPPKQGNFQIIPC